MKLIWLLIVVIFTINAHTKSIQDDSIDVLKNDLITKSNHSSNHNTKWRRQIIGLFPRLTRKGTKLTISSKPVTIINKQENKPVQRKPLMRKLQIKNNNHKDKNIVKITTTRRPLMSTMKFTRKPHHVSLASNRKSNHSSFKLYRNHNNNYKTNENSSEKNLDDFKNVNVSAKNDSKEFETDNVVSRKSKTLLFLPSRINKTLINTKTVISRNTSENIHDSDGKLSANASLNNQNSEKKIKEDIVPVASKDQIDDIVKKTDDSDQNKPNLKDLIHAQPVEDKKLASESKTMIGGDEITPERDVGILDSRPKGASL